MFGQGCFEAGMTKNTYGTGSFVLMNVGPTCPPPVEGLLTSVAWTLARPETTAYALEGAIFVTGAAIQWLRDGLGIISAAAEIGPLAASVADSEGVYLVPAFAGLGSPWWDPYARGTIVGLSRGSGRAQVARAVVEAMAYQTRDVVTTMSEASGHPITSLRVDGGASVMDLLLQLQADQLQIPVARSRVADTTALGAAYLAGLAEGVWGSLDELAALWGSDAEATPQRRGDEKYETWLRAVERARRWEPEDPAACRPPPKKLRLGRPAGLRPVRPLGPPPRPPRRRLGRPAGLRPLRQPGCTFGSDRASLLEAAAVGLGRGAHDALEMLAQVGRRAHPAAGRDHVD